MTSALRYALPASMGHEFTHGSHGAAGGRSIRGVHLRLEAARATANERLCVGCRHEVKPVTVRDAF